MFQLFRWNSISNFEVSPREDSKSRNVQQSVPNLRFSGLPKGKFVFFQNLENL